MWPTIALSLEVKLAWGGPHFSDSTGQDRHSPVVQAETETIEQLLAPRDDLDVPITFDIVGVSNKQTRCVVSVRAQHSIAKGGTHCCDNESHHLRRDNVDSRRPHVG